MVPAAFCWVLVQDIETIRSKRFENQYGPLFEGLKLDNKWYLTYYVVFILRRLLFFGIAIMKTDTDSAFLQIMLLMYMNIFMIIYTAGLNPMKVRSVNRVLLANELLISFTTIQMLLFTDWVSDEEDKFFFGWHISFYILVMVVFNFYFILKSAARTIYLLGVKYWRRFKHRFWPEKVEEPEIQEVPMVEPQFFHIVPNEAEMQEMAAITEE